MSRLLLLVVFACPLVAQQGGLDKGKPIVDKALAALGGDRFLHMQTRMSRGRVFSFFHEQLSGLSIASIYTEYLPQKAADGLAIRERQAFGKKEDYYVLFLPNQGWDVTFRGARPIADESWKRYVDSTENNIFYILRERYNEPGLTFDYVGKDVFLSSEVDVVDITDSNARTVRVSFDRNTSLPLHQSYSWRDPETKYRNDETSDFDKYRDAGDGVLWPLTIHRERNGYKTFEIFADKVEINKPLPPKTYDLPAGAKILKKVD